MMLTMNCHRQKQLVNNEKIDFFWIGEDFSHEARRGEIHYIVEKKSQYCRIVYSLNTHNIPQPMPGVRGFNTWRLLIKLSLQKKMEGPLQTNNLEKTKTLIFDLKVLLKMYNFVSEQLKENLKSSRITNLKKVDLFIWLLYKSICMNIANEYETGSEKLL